MTDESAGPQSEPPAGSTADHTSDPTAGSGAEPTAGSGAEPTAPSGVWPGDDAALVPPSPPTRAAQPIPADLPPPSGDPYPAQSVPALAGLDTVPLHALGGATAPVVPWPQPPFVGGSGTRPRYALIAGAIAAAAAIAVVAGLIGAVTGAWLVGRGSIGSSAGARLPAPGPAASSRPAGSIAGIAARTLPSVVTIKIKAADGEGTGSGFVIRSDGYILTNDHVVAAAGSTGTITVEWSNGTEMPAKVVGRDASYDLAVIRVSRTGLPALTLGESSKSVVGDEVIAVGAPLGLESTVTSGIISALNRPVTTADSNKAPAFINAIQTDAAINPGNSGGPLLDMSGEVIGINSAIARVPGSDPLSTTQSGNIGVGFSIPSDQARRTAMQLIATGKASHPVIGVTLDSTYSGPGVRIISTSVNGSPPVTAGGPGARAGLRPGDLLLTLDGQPITDSDQFIVAIRAHAAGDRVQLGVKRGSKAQTVTVTLQAKTDG